MDQPTSADSCHPDLLRFWQMLTERMCMGQRLLDVLDAIEEALPPGPLGRVATALADDVRRGSALSDAMKRHPTIFSRAHLCLVEGGERLGIIDRVLLLILESTWKCPTCGNLQFPGNQPAPVNPR